jgi:hypothetical protein
MARDRLTSVLDCWLHAYIPYGGVARTHACFTLRANSAPYAASRHQGQLLRASKLDCNHQKL